MKKKILLPIALISLFAMASASAGTKCKVTFIERESIISFAVYPIRVLGESLKKCKSLAEDQVGTYITSSSLTYKGSNQFGMQSENMFVHRAKYKFTDVDGEVVKGAFKLGRDGKSVLEK